MTNAAYQVECVARLKQHTIKPIAAKAMKKLTGTACAGAGVNTGNSWLDVNTVQKRSAFATTNLPPGKLVFHKYRANKCEQFVFFVVWWIRKESAVHVSYKNCEILSYVLAQCAKMGLKFFRKFALWTSSLRDVIARCRSCKVFFKCRWTNAQFFLNPMEPGLVWNYWLQIHNTSLIYITTKRFTFLLL